MADALARRYNFKGPLDPDIWKQLDDPFIFNFYQALLEELDTDEVLILKFLDDRLMFWFDHFMDVMDRHGSMNWNAHCNKKQYTIKTMFPGRKRFSGSSRDENVKFIPGIGKVKITPMEYDD